MVRETLQYKRNHIVGLFCIIITSNLVLFRPIFISMTGHLKYACLCVYNNVHNSTYILQNMWTRIKANAKNELAEERRQRFKTGGGTYGAETSAATNLVAGVCQSQTPLDGIPDNDHVNSEGEFE